MNRKQKIVFFMPLLLVSLFACNESDNISYNNELVFSAAKEIIIPQYEYSEADTVFHVKGSINFTSADTVSDNPDIVWDTTKTVNVKLIVSAIFVNPVMVNNGSITNSEDIIWIWHSGLDTETNGRIKYNEGRSMMNSDINNLTPALPLLSGNTYYWAIWAWSSASAEVILSSKQLKFFVL